MSSFSFRTHETFINQHSHSPSPDHPPTPPIHRRARHHQHDLEADVQKFHRQLLSAYPEIRSLVARHLRVEPLCLVLGQIRDHRGGSFTVSIPITVSTPGRHLPATVWIRFTSPARCGETFALGNTEERTRCEVATYLWLAQRCPGIPIPKLLGFGFPRGTTFNHVSNEPFLTRLRWMKERLLNCCSKQNGPSYVQFARDTVIHAAYLLVSDAEGTEVQDKDHQRMSTAHKENMSRSLAKILLTLAANPLPCIGSWTVSDDLVLSLSNRPLTRQLHELAARGIGCCIGRQITYTSKKAYFKDLLTCHRHVVSERHLVPISDLSNRWALGMTHTMRAMMPQFLDNSARHGPYYLSLTGLDRMNVFVDESWNVTCITGLSYACTRPIDMLGLPYWLHPRATQVAAPSFTPYSMDSVSDFESGREWQRRMLTEQHFAMRGSIPQDRAELLMRSLSSRSFWYLAMLDSPGIFRQLFRMRSSTGVARGLCGELLTTLVEQDLLDDFDARERPDYEWQLRSIITQPAAIHHLLRHVPMPAPWTEWWND